MSLFRAGIFKLFSGRSSDWAVNCDDLTDDDWDCIRNLILERHPNFSTVVGMTKNGKLLADLLNPFTTTGDVLLVDDVLNINLMQTQRLWYRTRMSYHSREVSGYVVFACMPCPSWVRALWQLDVRINEWEDPL